MPSYTITTLVARAKAIADMHDNFVTPTEWLNWFNQENYALRLYLARCGWVQEVLTSSCSITTATESSNVWDVTTAGSTVTLSSTTPGFSFQPEIASVTTHPMAIICVHESRDNGLRQLRYNNAIDILRQLPGSSLNTGSAREFRLVTNSNGHLHFNFFPTPLAGDVYIVSWIPEPTAADDLADTVSYPMGWEERIVLGMARRALIKEESDPGRVEQMMAQMESQIEELCWSRVLGENPSVRNVDQRIYGWTDRIAFPPWQQWAWV